jgi:c-di-GMP-binding flagellar brake protein YcgR
VVGYLDSVKVQFDVHGLVLVRGPAGSVLRCPMPHTLFRFQRRQAFRVRPLINSSPVARVPHPAQAQGTLALRVLDVSIGGCALLLPDDAPRVEAGVRLERVEFALDADTRFVVDVEVRHVAAVQSDGKGMRLGCMFLRASPETERILQRFIDSTQKRRRSMAL